MVFLFRPRPEILDVDLDLDVGRDNLETSFFCNKLNLNAAIKYSMSNKDLAVLTL